MALPISIGLAAVPVTFLGITLSSTLIPQVVLAGAAVASVLMATGFLDASTITVRMRDRLRAKLRKALTERVLSGPASLRHRMEQDLMRIARKILGE